MSTIDVILKSKRFSKESWTTNNPILADGELGFEKDTPNFKIGDGVTQWNDLEYVSSDIASRLAGNRKIGDAIFDNTKNITLEDIGALSKNGGHLTGNIFLGATDDYYMDNNGNAVLKGITVDTFTVKGELNLQVEETVNSGTLYYGGVKDYYIDGYANAKFRSLETEEDLTVGGNLTLNEDSSIILANNYYINQVGDAYLKTLHIAENGEIEGDLTVNGTTYFGGNTNYINKAGEGVLSSLRISGELDAVANAAKKLASPVKIGKASFDGSADITFDDIGVVPNAGGTFKGQTKMSADPIDAMDIATKQYVDNHTSGSSYMIIKGSLGDREGTVKEIPTTKVKRGDTYRVVNAGVYGPFTLKLGDAICALNDSEDDSELEVNDTNWMVLRTSSTLENYRVKVSNTEQSNVLEDDYTMGDIILGLAAAKHVTDNSRKELLTEEDDNLVTARSVVYHMKAALGEALDHITGGTVYTGTSYFGEEKTYYIDNTGNSLLKTLVIEEDLTVKGNINVTGKNGLISGLVTKARGDEKGNEFYSGYAGMLKVEDDKVVLYAKDKATVLSKETLPIPKGINMNEAYPESLTKYYLPMTTSTTGDTTSYGIDGVNTLVSIGNSNTDGFDKLILGNEIPTGSSRNAYGALRLYGKYDKYAEVLFEGDGLDDNLIFKLPNIGGTLVTNNTNTTFNGELTFANNINIGSDGYYIHKDGTGKFKDLVIDETLTMGSGSSIKEAGNHYFGGTTDYYINTLAEAKFKALEVETTSLFNGDTIFKGGTVKFGEKGTQFDANGNLTVVSITNNGVSNLKGNIIIGEAANGYYINSDATSKLKNLDIDTITAKSLTVDNFTPKGAMSITEDFKIGAATSDGTQYKIDKSANALFRSLTVTGATALNGDVTVKGNSIVDNLYFGSSKNYYVNNSARAKFKSLESEEDSSFKSTTESDDTDTGAVKISGGLAVKKTVSAKQFRIGDKAVLYYDDTNGCIRFSFSS